MNGIIILDGPDACGKTTLQKMFVERHGAAPVHLTYNKTVAPNMWGYMTNALVAATSLSQDHLVIVDRHWISEQIYAEVFRGGSPWPMMGRMMDRVWQKHAAITVLCLPLEPVSAIKRHNANIDASHPYPNNKFAELLTAYTDFANLPNIVNRADYVRYRIEREGTNIPEFTDWVLEQLIERQGCQYGPALSPTEHNILGHTSRAHLLFIGDQIDRKEGSAYAWPFYEYGNCSLYLSTVLNELGFDESTAMWTNSLTERGDRDMHAERLIDVYGLRPIFLGSAAYKRLKSFMKSRNNAMHVPHPQYAKRFNVREEFKKRLKEAIS